MTKNTKSFVLPLAFIGVMFFSLGFALGINSVLVPVLKGSLEISSAESYLIIAATFIPFLIFGYPAGLTIKKIGYKRTMVLSFLMFAIAFGLFIPSASYESFPLFLLASFISGSANAYLQAAVNPYITILGPIDSAAKRISIMGICNKLAWPIPPLFLAFLIGKEVTDITVADLFLPFYVIIAAFIALGIIAYMAPLPEVKAVGEDDSEEAAEACPYHLAIPAFIIRMSCSLLICRCRNRITGYISRLCHQPSFGKCSNVCLDCPDRHCDRLHLRHHLHP